MELKIGSTGNDVKKLQAKLGMTPDGNFGPVTDYYVKEWQKKNGLKPDGIVGKKTWVAMFPDEATIMAIDFERLRGLIPDQVLEQIPVTVKTFQINSALRLAHFLAQCYHESDGFKTVYENLNYSAERLKVIFSKYFPGNLADSYANNPVKIASRVYGNRMGNGDEASMDGFTYRGRGYIQLTGRDNYTAFAKYIGEDTVNDPDLVAKKYPLASAGFYFLDKNLWSICDKGEGAEVVKEVTKRINTGLLGLAERVRHFNEFCSLLK